MSDPVDALLPVLVAELADESERRSVLDLAAARATALVALVDAPVDASLHVLECTTPDHAEPLLVLAEPLGGPTEHGFPLRLHPYDSPPERPSAPLGPAAPGAPALPSVRVTRSRPATLTKHHTLDLLNEPRPGARAQGAPEDLIGRELGGKLLVETLVGIGGMGAVYRARHKQLGIPVAVKVLREDFRSDLQFCARFHAEALVLSQLDHPNLVRVIDYGQEPDGLLYLAMEFLEGIELQDLLLKSGTLPLPRIVDLGMQISAALGHAHMRGIVHRDVKPSNIVLVNAADDDGKPVNIVKVCDFGIAAHTGASDLLGTPAYMSPEQCSGGQLDGRSDIYSLGVIVYELATGQLPFSSDDGAEVVAMQRDDAPPPPSSVHNIDRRLEALILRMLAKSPDDRPRSMRHLRGELRELMRPPSLKLHDVGAGRNDRASGPPPAEGAPNATSIGPGRRPAPVPVLSTAQMKAVPDGRALATQLAREPLATLRDKLETAEGFASEAQALAAAMASMLEQRELAALAQVVAGLRSVGADPTDSARAELAVRLVRTLQDPARLAPIAVQALADDGEAATALLGSLGLAAAHALYATRLGAHATPTVRARFVSAMRAVGVASWPLVTAALVRNAPGDNEEYDERLAEDVLHSIPLVADDDVGGVVAKYLRWGGSPVRRAAIPPLVASWGARARPLLLAALLNDPDEDTRIKAVRGLRDLRAIDEHVVRKSEEILSTAPSDSTSVTGNAGNAIRVAVAEALAEARDDARALAAAALRRTLAPKGGLFGKLRSRAPSAPGPVVIAMACSYVAIGGDEASKLVDEVARQCDEPLRTQLLGLVGSSL